MPASNLFKVKFQIKKANVGNFVGKADAYRKDPQACLVVAASVHPKDILAVLSNNFTLGAGESFDVLDVSQFALGTEGTVMLT